MRVELQRIWPWLLASVVAFPLAFSATRADDSKAKTVSGQLTAKPAGLMGGAKPIGKSNPSTLIEPEWCFQPIRVLPTAFYPVALALTAAGAGM